MRLKTSAIYLSIGPAASESGRFNSLDSIEFAPISPARFRRALEAGFTHQGDEMYAWEENGDTVICGPVEFSTDFTEDGSEAFAEAPLEVDADLMRFVDLFESVRRVAPNIWIAIAGEDEMFLPRAFAEAVDSGALKLNDD